MMIFQCVKLRIYQKPDTKDVLFTAPHRGNLRHLRAVKTAPAGHPGQKGNHAMIADFEIEEHVSEHNRFFKQTHLTLDDLDTYAKPFGDFLHAVLGLSRGSITVLEAVKVMRRAASQLKAINGRIAKKYAA